MQNFTYYTPTKVVFGKETEAQTGSLIKQCGGSRVLLHYGGQSAEKSGLLGRIRTALNEAGLTFFELGGGRTNPHLGLVRQGIDLCKKEGVDFILAVGGGSVIDSAKGIACGAPGDGDVWDFFMRTRKLEKVLPIGAVVTIAAAGSEMSSSAVVTNEQTGQKIGLGSDLVRPLFAVMNPELTLTVDQYNTACGCADILMHTLERYFTSEPSPMGITDTLCEASMRQVIDTTSILLRDLANYNARAEMLWAGALSHNGLYECGNGHGDWAVHQMGHELSSKYDLAHGASLTTLWGSWARTVYKKQPERFARFAVEVLGMEAGADDETTALAGIDELESFFWGLELPTNFAEAGITPTEEDIEDMAQKCTRYGGRTIGDIIKMDEADIKTVLRLATQPVDV